MKIISALFLQHAPRYALMWRNARWEQFVWLRRAGFLLATMAAALCSYALSMAALGLDQDRHGHAKAEQEALAAQLLQQRIWLKQKNQQAQAHEQLEALVLAQEAQWPSPAQSNALLTRLQGLAETLGLFVEVFQVQEPSRWAAIQPNPCNFACVGRQQQCLSFGLASTKAILDGSLSKSAGAQVPKALLFSRPMRSCCWQGTPCTRSSYKPDQHAVTKTCLIPNALLQRLSSKARLLRKGVRQVNCPMSCPNGPWPK